MGRPVELFTDTLVAVLWVVPSFFALVFGTLAVMAGRRSRGFACGLIALVLSLAWVGCVANWWWSDVVHASPSAFHEPI